MKVEENAVASRFLSFKFKGAAKGDKVTVKWSDNKGDSRSDEATIP